MSRTRRPSRSSLFPYTTLFRSRQVNYYATNNAKEDYNIDTAQTSSIWDESSNQAHYKNRKLDRKSTRLNSSHVAISYAVFCLKKKKHVTRSSNNVHPYVTLEHS